MLLLTVSLLLCSRLCDKRLSAAVSLLCTAPPFTAHAVCMHAAAHERGGNDMPLTQFAYRSGPAVAIPTGSSFVRPELLHV